MTSFLNAVETYKTANTLISTRTLSDDQLTATTVRTFANNSVYTEFSNDLIIKLFFTTRDAYNANNDITVTETVTED
jgi:hypothetical protein